MARKAVIVALLAVLVSLSGCLGVTSSTPTSSEQDCGINSLAFWNVGDHHGWDSDKLRVGYELSGGADTLLVAYDNDTRLGEIHVTSTRAVASDGAPIPLDHPLEGSHTVRVLTFEDVNGNGQFDPETDSQCSVKTESLTLNFSTLNKTTTGA